MQDLPGMVSTTRTLHLFDQARSPVIADAQMPLHK